MKHTLLNNFVLITFQAVAVGDVRRELAFCKKLKLPVLGVIENMSGFVCPHCSVSNATFQSKAFTSKYVYWDLLYSLFSFVTNNIFEIKYCCNWFLFINIETHLNNDNKSKMCPFLQECTNIFSKGGGQALAEQFEVPFLGNVLNL